MLLFISKMKSIFSPSLPTIFFSSSSSSCQQTLISKSPNFLNFRKPISCLTSYSMESSSSSSVSALASASLSQVNSGEVHVIVGPMFAGKTTALLRRIQCETDNGRSVVVVKSNKDTRYGLDSIVTHDGAKLPCWALPDLMTFREKLGAEAYEKLDVIGIDEAQFFGDLYDFCCKAADHDGKTVIVAGLDGDYLRKRFGSVLDIIPLADTVTKLTARCELCGKRAFFTLRKTDDTQTELIGGADVYMPVCRRHYVSGQVVIEATRNVLEKQKAKMVSLFLGMIVIMKLLAVIGMMSYFGLITGRSCFAGWFPMASIFVVAVAWIIWELWCKPTYTEALSSPDCYYYDSSGGGIGNNEICSRKEGICWHDVSSVYSSISRIKFQLAQQLSSPTPHYIKIHV